MLKRFLLAAFVALNLAGGAGIATAQKYKTVMFYDPITHELLIACVNCWFWDCDCGGNQT